MSLVTVGLSLTVANGLVPLQNKSKEQRKINVRRREKDRAEKKTTIRKCSGSKYLLNDYNKRNENCISNCTNII